MLDTSFLFEPSFLFTEVNSDSSCTTLLFFPFSLKKCLVLPFTANSYEILQVLPPKSPLWLTFLVNSQFLLVWCCGDVGRERSNQVVHFKISFLLMTTWIPSDFLQPGRIGHMLFSFSSSLCPVFSEFLGCVSELITPLTFILWLSAQLWPCFHLWPS